MFAKSMVSSDTDDITEFLDDSIKSMYSHITLPYYQHLMFRSGVESSSF